MAAKRVKPKVRRRADRARQNIDERKRLARELPELLELQALLRDLGTRSALEIQHVDELVRGAERIDLSSQRTEFAREVTRVRQALSALDEMRRADHARARITLRLEDLAGQLHDGLLEQDAIGSLVLEVLGEVARAFPDVGVRLLTEAVAAELVEVVVRWSTRPVRRSGWSPHEALSGVWERAGLGKVDAKAWREDVRSRRR